MVQNNCAIKWASESGHLEVVKYLHTNGADITAENNRAIILANKNGHVKVVKYLYNHGIFIENLHCLQFIREKKVGKLIKRHY